MRTGQTIARKPARLVVALAVLVIAAGCAGEADGARDALSDRGTDDRSAPAEASTDDPTTTDAPTTTEAPTTTTTEPPMVESGTYVVPDQFAPGTYRVEGYWARLDANQEITDNDLADSGLTLMNVATDSSVEINGAAIALGDLPQVDPIAKGWTDGTHLVGTDSASGRYNVTSAGSSAYFARLDVNLEIIDNNLSEGNVIAVVEPNDWALSYTGTIQAMP
ncbi:MAG: hypothetical protein ACRDZ0_06520 [Acidimicrobiales bacterium]